MSFMASKSSREMRRQQDAAAKVQMNIRKMPFQLQKDCNGELINVHHTVTDANGIVKNIPFVNISFSEDNQLVTASDQSNNIFIFNLKTELYWMLNKHNGNKMVVGSGAKIKHITSLLFVPLTATTNTINRQLLVLVEDGKVFKIDVETGNILSTLIVQDQIQVGTISSRNNITMHDKTMYIIFHTMTEVKIYDLENFHLKYELGHERQVQEECGRNNNNNKIAMKGMKAVNGEGRQRCFRKKQKMGFNWNCWDTDTCIVYAGFVPGTCKIIIGLTNDTIQIWSWAFRAMKQTINVFRLRTKYLRIASVTRIEPFYDTDEQETDEIIKNLTEESSKGVIVDVQFSRSAYYCSVILQYLNELLLFVTSTSANRVGSSWCSRLAKNTSLVASTVYVPAWDLYKIIKFNEFPLATTKFLSPWMPVYHQLIGTTVDTKYLLVYTKTRDLILINVDNLTKRVIISKNNCVAFDGTHNGKMLAMIHLGNGCIGDLCIYSVQYFLDKIHDKETSLAMISTKGLEENTNKNRYGMRGGNGIKKRLEYIHLEMNKIISRNRLLPILKDFGEYPEKYRQTIWKTIMRLPQNPKAFISLLKQEHSAVAAAAAAATTTITSSSRGKSSSILHPCVATYDIQFPLHDQKMLRNLKKIISCLAYWCNLFAHLSFVPEFVFPFLKLWPHDSVCCFEIVATVLLNQCQLWFEFAPLQPYNYLAMIENVLKHFDIELYEFYCELNVTVHTYAWQLLQNALSEVLNQTQWYTVWDHIVTNEPHFLVFVIVAYNLMRKPGILKCKTDREVQNLLREPSPNICIRKLMTTSYKMDEACPANIHPKQYMKSFAPLKLEGRTYEPFDYYPKLLFETKSKVIDALHEEEHKLQTDFKELNQMDEKINEQMEQQLISDVHHHRLQKIQKLFESTIAKEEKKVTDLRNSLLQYQQEVNEKETETILNKIYSVLDNDVETKANELKELLKQTKRKKIKDETEMVFNQQLQKLHNLEEMKRQLHRNRPEHGKQEKLSEQQQKQVVDYDEYFEIYEKLIRERQESMQK